MSREGGGRDTEPPLGDTAETRSRSPVRTKQRRIAKLAREHPQRSFNSLAHHIDLAWLEEAYRRTRKDGARGVDGQTAQEYSQNLQENLEDLLNRAKSGHYQAPPVRRGYIPKGKPGQRRPIGIPTFEDKVLQRAVALVLEPIYEEDFLDCSYGFRPGRSPHQALQVLWREIQKLGGCWVLDVDVSNCFGALQHVWLRRFLRRRVSDGVIRRLIGKWLKAGVWEEGRTWYPEEGTPQGGVVSPLLSNLYLHEVLDVWFDQEVRPRLRGRALVVRFADDFVLGLEWEEDARRVLEVLPKRFARYGLTIHPEKTRKIRFLRPGGGQRQRATFDFLGFTHYWGRSRRGKWVVKRQTAQDRLSRGLKRLSSWCRKHRHQQVAEQHRVLCLKVRGHYLYYGITGNGKSLCAFGHEVTRIWRRWLNRRDRTRPMKWPRFELLLERYPLPPVRVYHSVYSAKP